MAILGNKKVAIPDRPNPIPDPSSRKEGVPFHNLFNFSRVRTPGKSITGVLEKPVLKNSRQDVPKADLGAVRTWVAMEEKIVHAPGIGRGQKLDEKKLQKIKIVGPQGERATGLETSKEKKAFLGLFSFLRAQTPSQKPLNVPHGSKEPVVKGSPLDLSKVNVAAVKDWVASEEVVVHAHQEQKTLRPKEADLSPRVPPRRVPTMPESLKTHTTVPLSVGTLIAQGPVRDQGKASRGLGRFLWVLGWLVGGAFVFFYAQAVFLSHQNEKKSLRLEGEKAQLEQAYVALKGASDDQTAEMIWLRSQIQDMTWELKEARSEMVVLRNTVRTKDEIVQALKAQTQALENIISQTRAAVSPKAAEAPRQLFSVVDPSVVRGVVSSINDQQGFIVVNVGSSQGVHSGQWIMIARSDKELAVGRIDRVYPTMSVAKLRDKKMFQMIREGDSVFFS